MKGKWIFFQWETLGHSSCALAFIPLHLCPSAVGAEWVGEKGSGLHVLVAFSSSGRMGSLLALLCLRCGWCCRWSSAIDTFTRHLQVLSESQWKRARGAFRLRDSTWNHVETLIGWKPLKVPPGSWERRAFSVEPCCLGHWRPPERFIFLMQTTPFWVSSAKTRAWWTGRRCSWMSLFFLLAIFPSCVHRVAAFFSGLSQSHNPISLHCQGAIYYKPGGLFLCCLRKEPKNGREVQKSTVCMAARLENIKYMARRWIAVLPLCKLMRIIVWASSSTTRARL